MRRSRWRVTSPECAVWKPSRAAWVGAPDLLFKLVGGCDMSQQAADRFSLRASALSHALRIQSHWRASRREDSGQPGEEDGASTRHNGPRRSGTAKARGKYLHFPARFRAPGALTAPTQPRMVTSAIGQRIQPLSRVLIADSLSPPLRAGWPVASEHSRRPRRRRPRTVCVEAAGRADATTALDEAVAAQLPVLAQSSSSAVHVRPSMRGRVVGAATFVCNLDGVIQRRCGRGRECTPRTAHGASFPCVTSRW